MFWLIHEDWWHPIIDWESWHTRQALWSNQLHCMQNNSLVWKEILFLKESCSGVRNTMRQYATNTWAHLLITDAVLTGIHLSFSPIHSGVFTTWGVSKSFSLILCGINFLAISGLIAKWYFYKTSQNVGIVGCLFEKVLVSYIEIIQSCTTESLFS